MGGAAFTEDALRQIFLELDTSGDGFLSYRELFDGLSGSGLNWDESYDRRLMLDRLWKEADRDGNGRVSFPEFWQLVAATRSPTEEELTRAYDFFRALDKSGDGVLDRLEIQEGLRNPDIDWSILGFDDNVSERHVFRMADVDGDNRVTFDEFWQLILRSVAAREAAAAEAAAQMVSVRDFASWTARDVGDWLDEIGFGQYRPAFEANGVHGYRLLGLTFDMLPRLQVRQFDHCKGIMRALRELKGAEPEAGESHNEALSRRRFNRRAPMELKRTLRFGRAEDFAAEEVRLMERYAKPQMVMKETV